MNATALARRSSYNDVPALAVGSVPRRLPSRRATCDNMTLVLPRSSSCGFSPRNSGSEATTDPPSPAGILSGHDDVCRGHARRPRTSLPRRSASYDHLGPGRLTWESTDDLVSSRRRASSESTGQGSSKQVPGLPRPSQPAVPAHRSLGVAAAAILSASMVHDVVADPEVGMLVAAGKTDFVTAHACGLAPSMTIPLGDAPHPGEPVVKGGGIEQSLRDFLSSDDSDQNAEFASCIASISYDEDTSVSASSFVSRARPSSGTPTESVSRASTTMGSFARSQGESQFSGGHEVLESLEEEDDEPESHRLQRKALAPAVAGMPISVV